MTSDQATDPDLIQVAQARSAIYRLLSRCFYRPTPDLLVDLEGPLAGLLQNLLNAFQIGSSDGMLALRSDGSAEGGSADGSQLASLREAYDRLFEGPGHVPVPPYESVHRKDVPEIERGLVMGPCSVDARRRYAQAGLAIAKDFTDLPDHIAVELEFMCYLCAKEAEAGGADKDGKFVQAQREFLRAHFMRWLPDFCEAVVHRSTVPFYRDLARLTLAFVNSEATELVEVDAGGQVH